jgi:bifunctional DNA-binding transcriptional regulator/antitoxin component of YhaV-PrlF toxin-antitoxin module
MTSYTRKLMKMASHSYAIVIPKSIITKYGWRERQKITIKDAGRGKLEVRDWKRH